MPPDATRVHIVKLGGSLLSWPEMPHRLADLLAASPARRPLLIVGGGAAADIVRDWHQAHAFDDDIAHTLAIEAMTLNAQLLVTLLPGAKIVSDHAQAGDEQNGGHRC